MGNSMYAAAPSPSEPPSSPLTEAMVGGGVTLVLRPNFAPPPRNLPSPWGPASMGGAVWHLHLSRGAGEFI